MCSSYLPGLSGRSICCFYSCVVHFVHARVRTSSILRQLAYLHTFTFMDDQCVCEWRCVWSAGLLQHESYSDVNSHSHAWPKHMALRQHTPCLHVLSFTLPLPLSLPLLVLFFFFLFTLLPRIHPFPQLCLLLHRQWSDYFPCCKYLSVTQFLLKNNKLNKPEMNCFFFSQCFFSTQCLFSAVMKYSLYCCRRAFSASVATHESCSS